MDFEKLLRARFFRYLLRYQDVGNARYSSASGVYLIIGLKHFPSDMDIFYVGATKNISQRWRIHKIKQSILDLGYFPTCLFLPMSAEAMGAYEIKLIKKLRPKFNVQHNKE